MPHSYSVPTRALPAKPSLAQLRKQAKELLKSFLAGHRAAVIEVERFEQSPDRERFALADAQRVLARAYGFSSWTKLKQHVEGVNAAAFCAAVNAGDVATVRRLAKARPELVHVEAAGFTGLPLHIAVLNRDAEMARVLMELGADARQGIWPHRDATTAYTIARERGYDDVVAVIEQGEEARRRATSPPGATIDSKTDQINRAILRDRCDEAIKILESDLSLVGACNVEQPINGVDCRRLAQGTTPLHVAAWKHNPEMVAWLLDRGAPVDARDAHGQTPLDYAAMIAGWSAHGRDFSFLENSHLDPSRFHDTVRLLREKGAELTSYAAVAIGNADAVRRMYREGRLKNEDWGRGGLLSIAVKVNRIDMVSLLLDLGLDANEPAEDGDGGSVGGAPLWFASMCGRHEVAELLISRGADVNAVLNGNAGRRKLRSRNRADVPAVYDAQVRGSLVELRPDARDAAGKLQAGVGPRRRSGRHRRRRPHDAAPPGDGHSQRRAPHHPGNAAARCRRVAQQARSVAEVDAAELGLPLGPHRACQTVPGPRRWSSGGGCRAVGNAFGMGYEGRAS